MLIIIYEIGLCIIDAFLAMWFIGKFKNDAYQFNIIPVIGILIHAGINTFALFVTVFSPVISIVNLIILILYSVIYNRAMPILKRLVAPFVFEGLLIASNTILFFLLTVLLNESFESTLNNKGVVFCVFGALSKLILWSFLSLALRLLSKTQELKFKDYFLLILFPMFIFCEMAILIKIGLTYHISEYYGYFCAAFITLGITYVCIYYLVYKITKNNQLKSEKELYKQMLEMEKRRYDDISYSTDQIKRIRHDMKHQLLVIQSRLKDNDVLGAQQMLDELSENVYSVGNVIETGNRLLDYILNSKLGRLPRTRVFISGDTSSLSQLTELDLSIIFGNLIDNSVEAVADLDQSQIEIMFFVKGTYQNIVIKNTLQNSILTNNDSLQTTKKDKNIHGYGLKSIKDIVKKYCGVVDIFEENEMFVVHIAIPIK